MVQSHFSLSWDTYQSSICKGFSSLQQNGEFVDMTLAADGHFVKVHQMLVALASPYLKELICSAPCQHPVIFLNNVSHPILCNILEYIYTGEVMVPADKLKVFFSTAKSLHIKGLENMVPSAPETSVLENVMPTTEENCISLADNAGHKIVNISTGENLQQVRLPSTAKNFHIKQESTMKSETKRLSAMPQVKDDSLNYSDADFYDHDNSDGENTNLENFGKESLPKQSIPATTNLQFTVSTRGSLQVILNRYIYNLHSVAQRMGVRRWRCVEYRNHRCLAFIITKGNVVINRANLHNHPFHDKKILGKLEKKAVYFALDDVEKVRAKEQAEQNEEETSTSTPTTVSDFVAVNQYNQNVSLKQSKSDVPEETATTSSNK